MHALANNQCCKHVTSTNTIQSDKLAKYIPSDTTLIATAATLFTWDVAAYAPKHNILEKMNHLHTCVLTPTATTSQVPKDYC